MVDSVSSNGGVSSVVPSKNDPALERREKKAEEVKTDQAREQDVVEISEKAQTLNQIEDTARETRIFLEKSDQPLSGGRVNALV